MIRCILYTTGWHDHCFYPSSIVHVACQLVQNFGRGEISSFLMKAPEEIGVPLSLQIWHDNSGGNAAGWYLGKVVLIDLQQKRW